MLPRSVSPPANVPAVDSFKTPKPMLNMNRTNLRGNNASTDSYSSGSQCASDRDTSSVRTRCSVESVHSNTLSHDSSLVEPMSRVQNLGYDTLPRWSYNSSFNYGPNQFASYADGEQSHYTNTHPIDQIQTDPNGFRIRETGSTVQGYMDHCRVPVYPHSLLTDTDKLQQFNSLAARQSSGRRQFLDPALDNRPLTGRLIAEPDHLAVDCNAFSPSESAYYHTAPHDLTTWIQQHRHQLRQQQQMADSLSQKRSLGHYSSMGNLISDSDTKVEFVKQAAEDIIKAKDNIIEKQKAKITHLENAALSSGNASFSSNLRLSSTNEQLLEKKLGATEYELRETKQALESKLRIKEETISSCNEKLKEKNKIISDWEQKYSILKSDVETLQKEIAKQKRYLSDLPTSTEHTENIRLIKSLKEEKLSDEGVIARLEKRLSESTDGLKSRELVVQSLEDSDKELRSKIKELEASNKDLLEKLSLRVDLLEMEQLKNDNRKLSGDLEKAKKFTDATNSRLQQQTLSHKQEMQNYHERLDQEAASVTALQQQVRDKEIIMKNYKQSIKEITAENQNLMESKMKLEDELKELRQPDRHEEMKLQQQLMKELSISLSDLHSLVKICLERANGQDPNLTAILGIRDATASESPESMTQLMTSVSLNSLKYQLSKARNLRHEIDTLREIISDKFAEDMGRRLTCNTQ